MQAENVINSKRVLSCLQLLNVYISTLSSRVEYLLKENGIPPTMEACLGSILACKGRFEIPEMSGVVTVFVFHL